MPTYTRRPEYRPGQTLRDCDVCGLRFYFPSEFEKGPDGLWRCKRFCAPRGKPEGEYVQVRDKLRASVGAMLRELPPPPGARDFKTTPSFIEEASLFDFLMRWGKYDVVAATAGQPAATALSSAAASETVRYLYGITQDADCPSRWREQAPAQIQVLADWLLTQQSDSGGGQGDFGGFAEGSVHAETYYAVDAAACGLAMCRAYQLTSADKYLTAAKSAATFLRSMQCSGWFSFGPNTTEDAAGLVPWHHGGMAQQFQGGGVAEPFTHAFYPDSLAAVEFLEVLRGLSGDVTAGHPLTPGQWAQDCRAPLSQMVSELRAYWVEAGTGFSASTPAEYFAAYPDGAGAWQKVDGTKITPRRWAMALRSLFAVDGASAQVSALYAYLMATAADPATAAPATLTDAQLAVSTLGAFDPKLAPPTLVNVVTHANATSLYDIAAAGCVAPLAAATNPASLLELKTTLAHRNWRTADGDVAAAQDDARLMGVCGLSFQTHSTTPVPGLVNYRPALAAMVGNLYRYS